MILVCALLVQLVERRSPKPDVEGSSPSGRVRKTIMSHIVGTITLQKFLARLESSDPSELVDGQRTLKMSLISPHSRAQ